MSKLKKTPTEKKVKLTEYRDQFVTVWPTEKNKFHKAGESFKIHPDQAKHLIDKGMATDVEPETEDESSEEGGAE